MAPAGSFAPSGQKISEKSGGAVVDCGVGGMNRHWFGDGKDTTSLGSGIRVR